MNNSFALGDFFTLLGFLVGGAVFFYEARRRKLATEGFIFIALAALVGGVIGARAAALLYAPQVLMGGELAAHSPLGKSLLGGVIGGWLAVELCKKYLGIRRSSGDLFALAIPAGEAVGRIGCFFHGCCFGTICEARWSVFQHGAWRHPAQIYAACIALLIFLTLWSLRRTLTKEGQLFALFLLLFGAGRFTLEFFRERALVWHNLSLMQLLMLALMLYALAKLRTLSTQRGAMEGKKCNARIVE